MTIDPTDALPPVFRRVRADRQEQQMTSEPIPPADAPAIDTEDPTGDEFEFGEPPAPMRRTEKDDKARRFAQAVIDRAQTARVPDGLGRSVVISAFARAGHHVDITTRTVEDGKTAMWATSAGPIRAD